MKDIEHQKLADGSILLEKVGNEIARIGEEFKAEYPEQTCGPIGAVVGATQEADARYLRDKYPDVFFLIPGYGAQGGSGKDLKGFFNEDGLGAIINSSRGIIAAYKNEKYAEFGAEGYADAARKATEDMIEDIRVNVF